MLIPDEEQENILSVFWMMLVDLESQAYSENDGVKSSLVEGGYNILNRIGFCNERPIWER